MHIGAMKPSKTLWGSWVQEPFCVPHFLFVGNKLQPSVNSKYIETHFGIFALKYFFSEGMENKEGEEVSTRELKKALQECVDAENKKKPLTDEQLVEEMERRGYKVARRTIAKYRGQLGIPLARWRKEL